MPFVKLYVRLRTFVLPWLLLLCFVCLSFLEILRGDICLSLLLNTLVMLPRKLLNFECFFERMQRRGAQINQIVLQFRPG